MGSLQSLWLMLAYAPVAPAPPPATPPAAEVLAPAPAPSPRDAAVPAPAPSPAPVATEAASPEPKPEAGPEPEALPAETPATDEPASQADPTSDPTPGPVDAAALPLDSDDEPPVAPYTVTVVHRGSVSAASHHQPEPQPREKFFVSGYGGITTRGSAVARKMGVLRGFHGGLLLGERLSIGAAYHRLKRRFGAPIVDRNNRPMGLEMAYGGVELGVTAFRRGRFELGVQTLFAGGVACVSYDVNQRSNVAECVESVRMMVLEPSAIAHLRVTNWMRVGIEGGYRGVARTQWRPPTDLDLGGGFFGLNLDFGWFGRDD